jgi:hypothetical protein
MACRHSLKKKKGMQKGGGGVADLHKETDEKFNKSAVHVKKEKRKKKKEKRKKKKEKRKKKKEKRNSEFCPVNQYKNSEYTKNSRSI